MSKAPKEPLISVIVPVYNVEKYLARCLDSIIAQTYTNLQIIVVDDGSTDNSSKICDEYAKKDKRIEVYHKKNEGVSSARNYGIQRTKGEIIGFVDSDDYVEASYIKLLEKNMQDNQSDISICGFKKVYDGKSDTIIRYKDGACFDKKTFVNKIMNVENAFGVCHMKLIKKEVIGENAFDETLTVGEDALFMVSISTNVSKVSYVGQALYNYRINQSSVVRRYDKNYLKKYEQSMQQMKEKMNAMYGGSLPNSYNNYVSYHAMLVLVNYCCNPKNSSKKQSIKELYRSPILSAGVKNANYDDLSRAKKISLFCLKHRITPACQLIGHYRQKQIRTGGGQ
jgi:glycosyltransferase involved in cell wall biosynthesis